MGNIKAVLITIPFCIVCITFAVYSKLYKEQIVHIFKPVPQVSKPNFKNVFNLTKIHAQLENITNKLDELGERFKEHDRKNGYKKAQDSILPALSGQKEVSKKVEDRILPVLSEQKEVYKKADRSLPVLSDKKVKTNGHVLVDKVPKTHVKYEVLILVSSNTPHFERRQNIRHLWANKSHWISHKWKVVFVTGGNQNEVTTKTLYREAVIHKDVIIEDIPESFYSMAKKVMIGLQWAHANFNYDYILKCDDDVYVNIDQLVNEVKKYKHSTYFGQLMDGQPVERQGRYKVSVEEHKNPKYDPYCSGGGFVLSHYTIQKVIPLFNWDNPLRIDDAYMGELVYKTGIKAEHNNGFYMWNDKCEYRNNLIVSHPAKTAKCLEYLLKQSLLRNVKEKVTVQ